MSQEVGAYSVCDWGGERECGISITDKSGFNHGEHGGGKRVLLDYDYFSGLMERVEAHPGGWAAARETSARQPEGQDERERTSQITRIEAEQAGQRLGGQASAEFSNPFTSELAQDSENTSPTRSANNPALAYRVGELGSDGGNQLADSEVFLEGQSQAGLQMGNQKGPTIRTANDPTASGEYSSSVSISVIGGKKTSTAPHALRMPYFMHPSVYHRGLHKRRSLGTVLDSRPSSPWPVKGETSFTGLDSAAKQRRRFRIGFFGTHDREFYTKHYHFPGMNRFETLEVFLQKFGNRIRRLRGFPRDWDPCEIAVSIDSKGGDRWGKFFLSQDHYFEALRECDFVLSPPGWCMPISHNLIEAMFCGAIPITNSGAFMAEPLVDDVNCLAFKNVEELAAAVERALAMDDCEVARIRKAVRDYYERFLDSKAFGERFIRTNSTRILVNAEEKSVTLVFSLSSYPMNAI